MEASHDRPGLLSSVDSGRESRGIPMAEAITGLDGGYGGKQVDASPNAVPKRMQVCRLGVGTGPLEMGAQGESGGCFFCMRLRCD